MATLNVGIGQTYATISLALLAAVNGDIIDIHAGTYTETLDLTKNDLFIRSHIGESPIVVGKIENDDCSGTTIMGLKVRGWGTALAADRGFHAADTTGLTLSGNTFYDAFGAGIYLRNCTNSIASNNEIYGMQDAPNVSATGIQVLSCGTTNGNFSGGVRLVDNDIHDNAVDGVNIHGHWITVSGNSVYSNITTDWMNTHPDGIQGLPGDIDGVLGVQHCRIYGNIFRNHTQNIFIEGAVDGDTNEFDILIYNNVVYNDAGIVNGVDMDAINTAGIVLRRLFQAGVFNNTLGRHKGNCIHLQESAAGSMTVKNNILSNNLGLGIYNETANQVSAGNLDYNLYNCVGNAVKWGNTSYATLALFQAAQPTQENHGVGSSSPLLNSFPSPTLQAASPAIGVGADLSSVFTTDFQGGVRNTPWDLGAYIFGIFTATTLNGMSCRIGS